MSIHELQLEQILSRLQAGESAETLVRDFPQHEAEVLFYARVAGEFSAFHTNTPSEVGLRNALSTMSVTEKSAPTPSPFVFARVAEASFIYRSALALPLLLIVVLVSGVYFWPHQAVGPNETPSPTGTFSANDSANAPESASLSMESSASGRTMMKTMAVTAPTPPALPEDTSLAAIYGPELTHDAQAIDDDGTQAQSAADDIAATEAYTNAYDEQDF